MRAKTNTFMFSPPPNLILSQAMPLHQSCIQPISIQDRITKSTEPDPGQISIPVANILSIFSSKPTGADPSSSPWLYISESSHLKIPPPDKWLCTICISTYDMKPAPLIFSFNTLADPVIFKDCMYPFTFYILHQN